MAVPGLFHRFSVSLNGYLVAERTDGDVQKLFYQLEVCILRSDKLLDELIVIKFKIDFCHDDCPFMKLYYLVLCRRRLKSWLRLRLL